MKTFFLIVRASCMLAVLVGGAVAMEVVSANLHWSAPLAVMAACFFLARAVDLP